MRFSISRSWTSIWVWLLWGLGIYLALEAGPFLLLGFALKKTAAELAGPYLAFAVPWAIMAPLIWWLRKWEKQGMSPKRLARGWGLSMALFGVAVVVAVSYSGVKLGLMNPMDAVGGLVVSVLLSVPISYFGMYHMVLTRISSRTTGRQRSPCPK
jgi:hypothetical protein